MEASQKTMDGHHRATHQRSRIGLWYPGRVYVSSHKDIFDMIDIDLFTVIAMNMMVVKLGYTGESEPLFYNYLRSLTSLDEGLYALACDEDVRCLATLVRSFKLIEVYIEHGVMALDCYTRPPQFRVAIKDITDEPGSIVANRTKKLLLLTLHESSEPTKELVCDSATPSSLPQHDLSTPCKVSVCDSITPRELTHKAIFSQQYNHSLVTNLSFFSQQATASKVIDDVMRQLSFEETKLDGEAGFADVVGVVSTQSTIVEEVGIHKFTVEDVVLEYYDDEGIDIAYETEYDVQFSEDAGTDDDDDEDFLVDEENEIVEPDVDVHLFGISMDLPFDNISVTNLVLDDVLEGEDVDVINADGFDSDPGNDDETNDYRMRRLAELSREIEVRVNPDIPFKAVQDQHQHDLEVQISMSRAFRAKAKAEREIRGDHVLQYSMLRDYVVELQSTNPNTTVKIAVEKNTDPSLPTRCLGDDIDLHPNLNFTFIGDRQKGIILAIKTVFPNAENKYCLRHIHENMKRGWCGQAYKDLLWRVASATSVKEFKKCILKLKTMNPKAHEWLNKIPPEHWARSYFLGRAKSNLLLDNIYEVFNGKIVGGRDKPVITLLEYIREYCMKSFVNVQSVIGKCTGPLTPIVTRIMESIKKEAHLMKVQWNGANKYQVSGSLGDQCVVDVVTMTCSCRKWELTGIPFSQDGSGGSGVGVVIGLSDAAGQVGAGGPGDAGVGSQVSSHSRWTKRRVQTERISPQKRTLTQPASQPSASSQVRVSETKNVDGREIGDGIPTQSSAADGASEWSLL
ncbi:hypothetical protein Tco_0809245 [Tanacetum coccineum]